MRLSMKPVATMPGGVVAVLLAHVQPTHHLATAEGGFCHHGDVRSLPLGGIGQNICSPGRNRPSSGLTSDIQLQRGGTGAPLIVGVAAVISNRSPRLRMTVSFSDSVIPGGTSGTGSRGAETTLYWLDVTLTPWSWPTHTKQPSYSFLALLMVTPRWGSLW
ncbi:hypothetical protein EYF80_006053 [Liparis tanakae]|uniref:Uncharacterized protein n=1 Tax=Liparis tanakae TaxID=230148 RepID=A0A4Z2IZQ5_9TELE|nr:hypothetical protein EYF80_006053 [Liparis tanakae]